MDPRILEIARQVCHTKETGFDPEKYGLPQDPAIFKQFAELIWDAAREHGYDEGWSDAEAKLTPGV
jgi:hypothetical protein